MAQGFTRKCLSWCERIAAFLVCTGPVLAQDQPNRPPSLPDLGPPPSGDFWPGGGGRGGFPGGPRRTERKVVKQFDTDKDERLDTVERKAAREFLKTQPADKPGRPP